MNWDKIEGNWKQMKGQAQARWGKLTDDHLTEIEGNQEILIGKIQEEYGVARDEAEKQVNEWSRGL